MSGMRCRQRLRVAGGEFTRPADDRSNHVVRDLQHVAGLVAPTATTSSTHAAAAVAAASVPSAAAAVSATIPAAAIASTSTVTAAALAVPATLAVPKSATFALAIPASARPIIGRHVFVPVIKKYAKMPPMLVSDNRQSHHGTRSRRFSTLEDLLENLSS